VYITVKRNWFAVMPEFSAMGEKGSVLDVPDMRDGSVPTENRSLARNSRQTALDRAGVFLVRRRRIPFEPLPPAIQRTVHRTRYTYFYHISPDSVKLAGMKPARNKSSAACFWLCSFSSLSRARAAPVLPMNEQESRLPLVAIVGPTASGKSALGVWLAERLAAKWWPAIHGSCIGIRCWHGQA